MGSGKELKKDIEKYGIKNFEKTILFECSSEQEMSDKEAEIVNEEFIKRPDVYNVVPGGGSWSPIHKMQLHKLGGVRAMSINKKNGKNPWADFWNSLSDEEKCKWKNEHPNAMKYRGFKNGVSPWLGCHHSEQTKKKISDTNRARGTQKGTRNSNYGNKWVHNDVLGISICVPDMLYWDYLGTGWINGRGNGYLTKEARDKMSEKSRQHKGFIYVNNGKIEKQITKNEYIPEGFSKGRISRKHKKHSQKTLTKILEFKDRKYNELKPMLDVFEKQGFDAVKKEFCYPFTRNNLVMQFKKYIPEYIPNKHTSNTKAKRFNAIMTQ